MIDEEVALRCLRKHVDEAGASLILGGSTATTSFVLITDPLRSRQFWLFQERRSICQSSFEIIQDLVTQTA